MKTLGFEEMLAMFDEPLRPRVITALDSVNGLAIYTDGKQVKALALSASPDLELDNGFTLAGVYENPRLNVAVSRTQRAVQMVQRTGCTPYAAAVKEGLSPSAVYRGLERANAKRCPCCGQPVRALVQSHH